MPFSDSYVRNLSSLRKRTTMSLALIICFQIATSLPNVFLMLFTNSSVPMSYEDLTLTGDFKSTAVICGFKAPAMMECRI
jgi:hypothetical protein